MYLNMEEIRGFNLGALVEESNQAIELLLTLYSGVVDDYCRTKFQPTRREFTSDVTSQIRLPKAPLLQVVGVSYLNQVLAEGTDYYVYPETGIVELAETIVYSKKKQSIKISYLYGYLEVPMMVKKVILDLMKLDVQSKDRDGMIIQESFADEYSYQKNSTKTTEDLRQGVLALLDGFIQPEYVSIPQTVGNVRARLV